VTGSRLIGEEHSLNADLRRIADLRQHRARLRAIALERGKDHSQRPQSKIVFFSAFFTVSAVLSGSSTHRGCSEDREDLN
jgi:hypothetical protein